MSHKKSTALRLLHGNPGKQPINRNEPEFSGTVTMPTWLSPAAKKEWRRVVALLEPSGVLQGTDENQLASYCQSFSDWRDAVQNVRKLGQVITLDTFTRAGVKNGTKSIVNPWVKLVLEHQKAMLRSAALFGLDPTNRSRIEVLPVDDDVWNAWTRDPSRSNGDLHGRFVELMETRQQQ